MNMRRPAVIITIVIIAAAAAFYFTKNNKSAEQASYKTERVTRGDLVSSVTATGVVNPVTTVLVGTQVSGQVKEIFVDFNSPVKRGQLLALIDPEHFSAQLLEAEAALEMSRANLWKSEVALENARLGVERKRQLFKEQVIPSGEIDDAEAAFRTAEAQIEASKAQVTQSGAALAMARINLANTEIKSPDDGMVISRNVDVGQTVAASFQTPTLFTIARDLRKMQINTNVAEADIGRIVKGLDVEFTVDAFPDITFKGKVTQVRNAPQTVQNVVTYDVIIEVDNSAMKLRPGMTANVTVIVERKRDVLTVPNAALRFVPDEAKKKPSSPGGSLVWTLEGGKPSPLDIRAGITDGLRTEVIGNAVAEGSEVITGANGDKNKSQQKQRATRMF